MKKIIITIIAMLLPLLASADANGTCGENLTWSYVETTNTLTISGTGEMTNYSYSNAPWNSFKSSIKNIIIESGVTSIGNAAFWNCSGLTSITIPNSVTSIGYYAFSSSALTSITIPNSVTSIGDHAFYYCRGLTSVTIGNSVTSIGQEAFINCISLTSITVNSGNTKYDSRNNCNAIIEKSSNTLVAGCKNTIIPNSVTSIGNGAFASCSSLTSITIPNSVTSIGWSAFSGCTGLTSVIIPNSVTSIDSYAFSGCTGLTSITIPNSVASIGESAFRNCSGLTSITVNSGNTKYDSRDNCNAIIEKSSNTLVAGCKNTIIPSSVTSIGSAAFDECSGLTYITIPTSVTSIGSAAFYNCIGLTSITIPNSVTSIGDYAFSGCSGLTSITIPNSVTSIGNNAFSYCSGLTSITIPQSVTSIGEFAFQNCSGLTSIVSKIEKPFDISDNVFSNNIVKVIVPVGTKSAYQSKAGWMKFQNIVELEKKSIHVATAGTLPNLIPDNEKSLIGELTLTGNLNGTDIACIRRMAGAPVNLDMEKGGAYNKEESGKTYGKLSVLDISGASIISGGDYYYKEWGRKYDDDKNYRSLFTSYTSNNTISGYMFIDCKLSKITLPQNATSIDGSAFSGCSSLTSIDIPNSVTSIGNYAFSNCRGLTSVTIPNSVTSIGSSAFSGCSGLTSIDIPNSVTSIEYSAFSGCSSLTSVNIPNSVTSIGEWSFRACSSLTSITIPNSVTSIGQESFRACSSLTSVIIGNSVTSIDGSAFYGCSGLTSIYVNSGNTKYDSRDNCNAIIEKSSNTLVAGCKNTIIPNSVTSIGGIAFSGCSGLISLTIPNSVTSIGDGAFYGCGGLTSIDIPNSVTSIGSSAFKNCSGLTSVTIPNSVTSIGSDAFYGCNNLKYICLTSDVFPSFSTYYISTNCQLIIPQKAYESGIPSGVKNFSTYSDTPMLIQVKSKTATSAVIELRPVNDPDNAVYTVTTNGQTPGQNLRWKLDDQNYGIVSEKADETLTLEVQAAEAMSINKARLLSTVTADEPDDDQHYGFEWLRYDAPEGMNPYQVSAPLYKSQIVGALGNLNSEKYYKYRPFYKSDDGTIFRGEWTIFTTGDYYVFFEPDVHTKEPVVLSDGGIVLLLFFAEGTEEILEKGFELIKKALESFGTRSDGGDVTKVIVSGNEMSATVEGLEPGTEYIYRSYVKTASGTTYGEEVTFKTPLPGDANNDGVINAADIVEVVNAKAGNPSASFIMTNADMDGSGSLTEADINAIVNIIMQK